MFDPDWNRSAVWPFLGGGGGGGGQGTLDLT